MHGEGEILRCNACGNGARVNADYSLTPLDETCVLPETPKRWFDEERKIVYREILDPAFQMTERVRLGVLPKFELLKNLATSIIVGEGKLHLDHTGLSYSGTKEGEAFSFHLEPKLLPTYGMCTDVSRVYTFFAGEFYEFFPETECVAKWLRATEELHRLHGGEWKNYPWADTYA